MGLPAMLLAHVSPHLTPRLYWGTAIDQVGLEGTRIRNVTIGPLGWIVTLRLRPPATAALVEAKADLLATALGASRVRVIPAWPRRADEATIYIDYQTSLASLPYPTQPFASVSSDSTIPLGYDDNAKPVTLRLYGSSLLVGGNPGAGKSNALRVILAGLSRQQHTQLIGLDPKSVELAPWRPRFSQLITGTDPGPVIDVLTQLLDLIHDRASTMAARGQVLITPTAEHPAVFLVVDEWAELAATGNKLERSQTTELLRRVVSLGRAVGVSAIIATQRPTGDTIDPGTRALLGHRLAFRCGDKWQAEALLGPGHHEPLQIAPDTPGRAYLTSGADTSAIQVYYIEPDTIPDYLRAWRKP